jgi:hypothetical protein
VKFLGILFFILTPILVSAQSYDAFKWKKRVVVFAGDEDWVKKNYAQFDDQLGVQERNLVFLWDNGEALISLPPSKKNRAWGRPTFIQDPYQFYLIGLDGGLKEKRKKSMSQQELFALIDSMPMRLNEMKKGNE